MKAFRAPLGEPAEMPNVICHDPVPEIRKLAAERIWAVVSELGSEGLSRFCTVP